jgi:uncharacterized protein involved in cytokinesis, contains TGc (transglutaminase/protease-like) domain
VHILKKLKIYLSLAILYFLILFKFETFANPAVIYTPDGKVNLNITYIALDLYNNEKDEVIRNLGVDTILASVKTTESGENYVTVGVYDKDPRLLLFNNALISTEPSGFIDMGDKVKVTIPYIGTQKTTEQNVRYIKNLYETAVKIKEVTAGWSDFYKARYIVNYICNKCEYDYSLKVYGAAPMLTDGKGTCQAYASLFYILGRYCGLKVNIVPGRFIDNTKSDNHVWNQIDMDGRWVFVDITSYDQTKDERYFLQPIERQADIYKIFKGDYETMFNLYKDI